MKYTYQTQGTCSQEIEVELEDKTVKAVRFKGGCHGNLQGLASLVEGMKVDEVICKLNGIRCGAKATSCPDQLCRALEEAISAS